MINDDDPRTAAPEIRVTRKPWIRRHRILIGLLVALLLLPVVLLGVAAVLLPTEVVARAAASRAGAALGVPVEIADLELDFFPVPSVALVGGRLGPESAPVATLDRVLLRPKLLPLFSGRVIVSEVSIDRPVVHLAVDSAGALNLPFGGDDDDAPADPSTARIDFQVDDLRVRNGTLRWSDARDGTDVVVTGLEQSLRIAGRVGEGGLANIGLQGRIASDSVDADLPGRLAAPLRGVRFAIEHDAEFDRDADRLTLADMRLEIQRLALQGSGRIDGVADSLNRAVELDLAAEEFDFEDLARSLPPGFLEGMIRSGPSAGGAPGGVGEEVTVGDRVDQSFAGAATITARVSGPITRDSVPAVEGEVRLRDAGVDHGGASVLSSTAATIQFSNQRVASPDVRGNLFGAPFTLAFDVADLAAPVVEFQARGTAALAEILALAPASDEEPIRASGNLPFELGGSLVSADPVRSRIEGTVGLAGLRAELPSLLQPIEVTGGRARFAGDQLHLEDLATAFGESRLRATATVEEWLPVALGDTAAVARARFDASAGTLDLDALLGPSESEYTPLLFARLTDGTVDGRPVEEVARDLGVSLPELPRLRALGELRIERLVRNGMVFEGVEARVESSPEAVSLPRVRFGFLGGTIELGIALERGEDDANLVAVYELQNVGAGAFFSRFTPFQGHLTGLLTLAGEASLLLDDYMLPVRPTVRSEGRAAFTSGSLTNWPLVARVGERLGLQSFDTIAFREWSGDFALAGPLVSLQRAAQVSDGLRTEMAGSFDLSGALDLALVAHLSSELAAGAGEQVRGAAASLAGADGTVPVGLRITGTTRSPTIALDLSAARDQAIARARERATEEARGAAERAASEVARRTLGDSIPADPAAIGEAVRERVGDRIRGLFGRQTAQPAAPADSAQGDSVEAAGGGADADSVVANEG